MKTFRAIFLLWLICLLTVFPVFSQKKKDKTEPQPINIKANLLITDTSDFLANDVKPEDIKIYEDGVEQKITYFAEKESSLNLSLVIDNTGSMRTKLDEILFAGSVLIANLRPQDEATAIRFVDSSNIEVKQEWTSNKDKLRSALENMYVSGGQSAVLDAVYLAADATLKHAGEDKSKRYAIVLISDVEERASYYKYDEVLKLFKDTDLQVFILSYGEDAPEMKNQAVKLGNRLALDTGGTIHNLARKHSREDLIEALKKLVFELRSNYVVGYTPTNQNRDGLTRKLTAEVADNAKGEKRKTTIRDGFTVPKEK